MTRPTDKRNKYEQEVARKAHMQKVSKERYGKWGNTLEALREKKKRDRFERLASIEKAQQALDEHEAILGAERRREAIDKANRKLFYENDRVKSFSSAMMLSSVMQERGRQIELKRKKSAHEQHMEKMWLQIQEENLDAQYKREESEARTRKDKSVKLAATQMQQLEDYRVKQHQERIMEIREGERNKRIAQEAIKEARDAEIRKHETIIESNKSYMRANVESRKVKVEKQRLEDMEDAKIESYAKESERLKQARKDAEKSRFDAKQALNAKMLAKQYEHLMSLRQNENARLDGQVAEQKERDDKAEADKAAKRQHMQDFIVRSRTNQLARKQKDKERQKLESRVMADQWANQARHMERLESEERLQMKQEALDYQSYLDVQRHEKSDREALARTEAIAGVKEYNSRINEDEEVFTHFAKTKMQEYKSKGRSIVPMALDLMRYERSKKSVAML